MKVDVFPTQIWRYRVEDSDVLRDQVTKFYEDNKWKNGGEFPEGGTVNSLPPLELAHILLAMC